MAKYPNDQLSSSARRNWARASTNLSHWPLAFNSAFNFGSFKSAINAIRILKLTPTGSQSFSCSASASMMPMNKYAEMRRQDQKARS